MEHTIAIWLGLVVFYEGGVGHQELTPAGEMKIG
jgi:hypothetical protein